MAAMLTAMSVVIGIFCKNFLNFGAGLFRVSFESFPILLSGIMLGPIIGGVVGAATDIISYLMSGQAYPFDFVVMLGSALTGIVSGVIAKYIIKRKSARRIIIPSAAAHVVGSMIVKTVGLYAYYDWAALWRIPVYCAIAPLEIAIMCLMYKNSAIKRIVDSFWEGSE